MRVAVLKRKVVSKNKMVFDDGLRYVVPVSWGVAGEAHDHQTESPGPLVDV